MEFVIVGNGRYTVVEYFNSCITRRMNQTGKNMSICVKFFV